MSLSTLMAQRHSEYALNKELPVAIEQVEETLKEVASLTPTAFHSQSSRMIVLEGAKHDRFWQIVEESLAAIVPAENFGPTKEKLAGFAGAYGTILFFDQTKTTKGLQEQYALYAHNFPKWAQQSNGMLTLAAWLALRELGIGANLQHYSEVVEGKLSEFDIPEGYELIGQMPFGGIVSKAEGKPSLAKEELVKIEK